jgi:cephalosporin hydroxylase
MKSPLDFWIDQEILWETRPAFIIELGNLCGGGPLALAHACDALGKGKIIAIDTTHADVCPGVRGIRASRCLPVMHVKCIRP